MGKLMSGRDSDSLALAAGDVIQVLAYPSTDPARRVRIVRKLAEPLLLASTTCPGQAVSSARRLPSRPLPPFAARKRPNRPVDDRDQPAVDPLAVWPFGARLRWRGRRCGGDAVDTGHDPVTVGNITNGRTRQGAKQRCHGNGKPNHHDRS